MAWREETDLAGKTLAVHLSSLRTHAHTLYHVWMKNLGYQALPTDALGGLHFISEVGGLCTEQIEMAELLEVPL